MITRVKSLTPRRRLALLGVRLARALGALILVLLAWLGLLAGVMRLAPQEAPAALVLLWPGQVLSALPPGAVLVGQTPFGPVLRGPKGLVQDLYAAGAFLVLPAGLTGCGAPLVR